MKACHLQRRHIEKIKKTLKALHVYLNCLLDLGKSDEFAETEEILKIVS